MFFFSDVHISPSLSLSSIFTCIWLTLLYFMYELTYLSYLRFGWTQRCNNQCTTVLVTLSYAFFIILWRSSDKAVYLERKISSDPSDLITNGQLSCDALSTCTMQVVCLRGSSHLNWCNLCSTASTLAPEKPCNTFQSCRLSKNLYLVPTCEFKAKHLGRYVNWTGRRRECEINFTNLGKPQKHSYRAKTNACIWSRSCSSSQLSLSTLGPSL